MIKFALLFTSAIIKVTKVIVGWIRTKADFILRKNYLRKSYFNGKCLTFRKIFWLFQNPSRRFFNCFEVFWILLNFSLLFWSFTDSFEGFLTFPEIFKNLFPIFPKNFPNSYEIFFNFFRRFSENVWPSSNMYFFTEIRL